MQNRRAEIPAIVRYPKERILLEYGGARRYFKNHVAWMIALALSEGATTIALFGVNYGHVSEYEMQRGSAEYWLGYAEGRGVHLMLPDECTLLAEPKGLYGYESHDGEGKLMDAYRQRMPKPAETLVPIGQGGERIPLAKPPAHLKEQIALDEMERPDWALGPLPDSAEVTEVPTDGSVAHGDGYTVQLLPLGEAPPSSDGKRKWIGVPEGALQTNEA